MAEDEATHSGSAVLGLQYENPSLYEVGSVTTTGSTPRAVTEQDASRWVRGMFGRIAGRYDLLNHLLSFNLDKRWRARTVERVADVLERPNARVLDLCCGTGDVLLALEDRGGRAVLGSDFCHPMLVEANRKIAAKRFRTLLNSNPTRLRCQWRTTRSISSLSRSDFATSRTMRAG